VLANLFEGAEERSPKTMGRWRDVYGLRPQIVIKFISEHRFWARLGIRATVAGVVVLFFYS
jgi:hypothetical protein